MIFRDCDHFEGILSTQTFCWEELKLDVIINDAENWQGSLPDLLILRQGENIQKRVLISLIGECHLLSEVVQSQIYALWIREQSSNDDINRIVALVLQCKAERGLNLRIFQILAIVFEGLEKAGLQ